MLSIRHALSGRQCFYPAMTVSSALLYVAFIDTLPTTPSDPEPTMRSVKGERLPATTRRVAAVIPGDQYTLAPPPLLDFQNVSVMPPYADDSFILCEYSLYCSS